MMTHETALWPAACSTWHMTDAIFLIFYTEISK